MALLLPLSGCDLFASNSSTSQDSFMLTEGQESAIIEYVFNNIDSYYNGSEVVVPGELADIDKDYYKIYITLLNDGEIRCSQSGSQQESSSTRVADDLAQAVTRCVEDERFGGAITGDEANNLDLVIDVLYNPERVDLYDLDSLEQAIELGVDALRFEKDSSSANFKSSVPISKNYTHEKTFNALCEKAGLDKNCYTDAAVTKYKFDSVTFFASRNSAPAELYRYNVLINTDDITNASIKNSIALGYDWMANDVSSETGMLEYMYYPSIDKYTSSDNEVRRLAATWAVTELMDYLGEESLENMVRTTLDHYLSKKETNNDGAYLVIGEDAKLAYNAFVIMALINTSDYPNRDELLEEFAGAILGQQVYDGSYKTDFIEGGTNGIDYYPGEAMLALMKLYNETGNEKYLKSVKDAFTYYRDYWKGNKNTAFIPWHTQAYALLYDAEPSEELADFIFEMNDWIIDNEQQLESAYPDYVGGFKERPSNSTASYLEGLGDAYRIAAAVGDNEHINKYKNSIELATRFVLQTQYTPLNTFYITNLEKALGGFRQSLTNNQQRNDYTQHATLSLIKIFNNNVFE